MVETKTLETYRSLRGTIKHATGDEPIRSVLVVDVDRKRPSNVALRLAESFSVAREKCVLIDTDFRSSDAETPGLSDLLTSGTEDIQLEQEDALTRIGPGTVDDPDLLSSEEFAATLSRIVSQYDYAILTCAAFPDAGDAVAIAPLVDAVILVISAGVTGREPAIQARDALERVGARILGMVMIERPRRWF